MSMMEAASSASSSDEDEIVSMNPIQSLDDLPSDDSVSLDSTTDEEEGEDAANASSNDSSASDDTSSVVSSDNDGENDYEDESRGSGRDGDGDDDDVEDVPLEERVRQRREAGVLSQHARADARERKSRALRVASERLKVATSLSTPIKKKSKHAPTEVSSKRSDYFKRGAPLLNSSGVGVEIGAHRYKPRDPRKSELVDPGRVNDNYAFLQELRDNEISALKKKIATHKLPGKKGQKTRRKMGIAQGSLKEDQEQLTRLLQEKASYERAQLDRRAKQVVKQKMKENGPAGKKVYYLKKREMKRLQLEAKFEELRKRGGDAAVDKALAKRRKKNKSKDTGFMPRDL